MCQGTACITSTSFQKGQFELYAIKRYGFVHNAVLLHLLIFIKKNVETDISIYFFRKVFVFRSNVFLIFAIH